VSAPPSTAGAKTEWRLVSIGRGAFYNPWIFQHTAHYLATDELSPEPSFDDRLNVMRRHLDLMVEIYGEESGCRQFRKIALQYSKRFGPTKEFDKRVVKLRHRAEFEEIITAYRQWRAKLLDATGELRPAYQPKPFSVPTGPNELW